MKLLKDKKILISGASSGIGHAAAMLFASEGAKLAVSARRLDKLQDLVEIISNKGGKAVAIQADLSTTKGVTEMISQSLDKLNGLNGAFNNAGTVGNFVPMLEQSVGDLDITVNLNLKAVWLACRLQAEFFQKHSIKGSIVNTSSWLASGALVGSSVYSASKAGVDAFIRAAAVELAPEGIRLNNINPGGIDTEMTRVAFNHDSDSLEAFARSHPVGRLGKPHEVAELAAWLLSDRSTFVTGQSITIDGGYAIPGQRAA